MRLEIWFLLLFGSVHTCAAVSHLLCTFCPGLLWNFANVGLSRSPTHAPLLIASGFLVTDLQYWVDSELVYSRVSFQVRC